MSDRSDSKHHLPLPASIWQSSLDPGWMPIPANPNIDPDRHSRPQLQIPPIFPAPPADNPYGPIPSIPQGPAPKIPPTVPNGPYYRSPAQSPSPSAPWKNIPSSPPAPRPSAPDGRDQVPQSNNRAISGPPTRMLRNQTVDVLRMKGIPDADIAAAISDPGQMMALLNQLYGRHPAPANAGGNEVANRDDGNRFAGRPDRDAAPNAAAPD
jgi:hypothetical protein